MGKYFTITLLLLLSTNTLLGCSVYSIVDAADPTQEITIVTNPPDAHCLLFREGRLVAEVNSSPGSLVVDRTKYDMSLICKKDGYKDGNETLKSGIAATPFWDLIELNVSGLAVNAVSGANNSYPGTTKITLIPTDALPPPL